jgi:hypothetical protein
MYDSWMSNAKRTVQFELVCILQKCFSNSVYYILSKKANINFWQIHNYSMVGSLLSIYTHNQHITRISTKHTWNKSTSLILLKSSSQSISCCISEQKSLWKSSIWETFSVKELTCKKRIILVTNLINCGRKVENISRTSSLGKNFSCLKGSKYRFNNVWTSWIQNKLRFIWW